MSVPKLTYAQAEDIRRRYWEPRERAGLLPGEQFDKDDPERGPTQVELAREYGVSDCTICDVVHGRRLRGEWSLRLSRSEYGAALARWRRGESMAQLARAYGVTKGYIWRVLAAQAPAAERALRRRHGPGRPRKAA